MVQTVSVITPLFQGEKHIAQCIESVIAQDRSDIEHVIIDNMSTDRGPDIVREYQRKHPHIKLLRNEIPGAGPTRNAGIKEARGRYIALLDADDWWLPEKLNQQIGAMQATGSGFSWTAYHVIGEDGRIQRTQHVPTQATLVSHLAKTITIGCLTAVYDSKLHGKRFMSDMKLRQDFCLWIDILRHSEEKKIPVIGLNEPLACYRVHSSGISADKRKAAMAQWQAYRTHAGLGRTASAAMFASYAFNAIRSRASSLLGA